jgi:hypothetical protein
MAPARSTLIDANLLTLWIVGSVSESMVERCTRTRGYSIEDYRKLADYLEEGRNVVVTPNVATETNSLINKLKGSYLLQGRAILARALTDWEEIYVESSRAVHGPDFLRSGLSDAATILTAADHVEVLTDDFDLYRTLLARGMAVKNFTHWRASGWLHE